LANFSGATFEKSADFSGVRFGADASFAGAAFGIEVEFSRATFGSRADFRVATLGHGASFSEATFDNAANFSCAIFDESATFVGTTFGVEANFAGATFGHGAQFIRATFRGRAHLRALSKEACRENICTLFTHWPEQRKQVLAAHKALHQSGAGPDGFGSISFEDAHFGGHAYFAGRKFFSHSGFTAARFYEPPTFDRCENTGRLNLYGARITFSGTLFGFIPGWTTDSDVGIRLRLLRKLADETKNHDLERDLYIEERRAERGIRLARYFRVGRPGWPRLVAHCLWIAIMGIYWLLADYGRSVIRPLIALVASIFVFNASYSVVLSPPPAMSETTFRNAVWAFTIANAVPFVGALSLEKELKDTILCAASSSPACDRVPKTAFQLLALGQSIVSGLLIFFVALALRNFFKLR
jgi:Pentapeptide repeats (9 copies)